MAVNAKDLETLWQRYKTEALPAGISVNQFFESNGVPYHVFEKWYKKNFQTPNVVECVVQGSPAPSTPVQQTERPAPTESLKPSNEVMVKYINIGLSDGLRIEHHNLSYSSFLLFIEKLKTLCLA